MERKQEEEEVSTDSHSNAEKEYKKLLDWHQRRGKLAMMILWHGKLLLHTFASVEEIIDNWSFQLVSKINKSFASVLPLFTHFLDSLIIVLKVKLLCML